MRFRNRQGVSGPARHLGSAGKDLRAFADLSRWPLLSYLGKLRLGHKPPHSLQTGGLQTGGFQKLGRFLATHRWIWLFDYVRFRLGRKHPFATYPPPETGIHPMPASLRMALASDWGTGTDEAAAIAALITAFQPHHSIHLGDVYYVGDPAEVRENFLGERNPHSRYAPCAWPRGSDGTFALNGNHEMYARGTGYFRLMLPALAQPASYFCLQNEHWRVIGLDTGYNSIGLPFIEKLVAPKADLPPPLLDWLRDHVFAQPDPRGLVILTHHQYYSNFDTWYPAAAAQLAAFIQRPVLWFWGHEHRLAIYPKYRVDPGIEAYGRCIGHGGMPVERTPKHPAHPECPAEFLDERAYPNDEGLDVGVNGFARLTFDADRLHVDYVGIDGHPVFTEDWQVDPEGALTRTAATTPPP